ncbi:aspartate aminotransferase family protein [Rhodococcus sp. NPDC057135]|uniref:aspartate aminotransferase family protein n=1 Tax=Rhodococcus sp. NPDC057135 TaxID=3346028 RepID=UPI003639B0BB
MTAHFHDARTSRVSPLDANGYVPENAAGLDARTRDLIRRRADILGPASPLMYRNPVEIVRAQGLRLYDRDGTSYLDMYNNVASVGHSHPKVVDAVRRQIAELNTHTRYLNEEIVQYAEDLVSTFPGQLSTVMFTCTGSEANDLALRIAREATGNTGVIVTENAYHGGTINIAACSPSMGSADSGDEPWVRVVPLPDPRVVADIDRESWFADRVRECIDGLNRDGIGVAALLVDTIFASDGVLTDSFLSTAVDQVHQAGGLFIADEVQPGFGRLGSGMWGFARHGVVADIVTLGKPMAGGVPLAGVVLGDNLVELTAGELRYFNTFGGNAVSIAAAQAVLDVIRGEELIENAAVMGARLTDGLRTSAHRDPRVGAIRGAGLFVGVDVVDADSGEPDPSGALDIVNGLRAHGVLISATGRHGNVLKIRPPLPISASDVDEFLTRFEMVLVA